MKNTLLKSLALGFAVSMIGLTVSADALAEVDSYRIAYYADASMTGPIVGREGVNCQGVYFNFGMATDYFTYTDVICPE